MKASDWQLPGLCSDVWELNVFPEKNVCKFLVQFCVQLQCSPDVNLLLDGIANHATLITSNLILTYKFSLFNPLSPISDQERISPHTIGTISSNQLGDYLLIQFQILQTNIIWVV